MSLKCGLCESGTWCEVHDGVHPEAEEDLTELLERYHLTHDEARVMLGHLYRKGESI